LKRINSNKLLLDFIFSQYEMKENNTEFFAENTLYIKYNRVIIDLYILRFN